MKKHILSLLLLVFFCTVVSAQNEQGVTPPAGASFGTFTEWKKVEVSFESGETASYEYRIALVSKKGLGCHYELEIKNTSSLKLEFKISSHYYDRLVKGNFGDKYEGKIKPGETKTFLIITQGCKAAKDKKGESDYDTCMDCGLSYEIAVSKP